MSIKLSLNYRNHIYKIGCDELSINKIRDEMSCFYQATLLVVEMISLPVKTTDDANYLTWEESDDINVLKQCDVIVSNLPIEIVINALEYITYNKLFLTKPAKFKSRDIDQSKITDFML